MEMMLFQFPTVMVSNSNSDTSNWTAQEFILVVMLTAWLQIPKELAVEGLELIEYFAGKARVAKMARRRGYSSRAVDITYTDPKPPRIDSFSKPRGSMDINGAAGFVFLSCINW